MREMELAGVRRGKRVTTTRPAARAARPVLRVRMPLVPVTAVSLICSNLDNSIA
jgi:hypothetical protein